MLFLSSPSGRRMRKGQHWAVAEIPGLDIMMVPISWLDVFAAAQ
jgi:hypothetical protein